MVTIQTSAPGNRQAGFTLIELLVVLVIVGLATAAVVFVARDPKDSLVAEAERFAARAQAAKSYAIINGRATSVLVDASGYTFAGSRKGTWQPLPDGVVSRGRWQSGTQPIGKSELRIVFDPIGLTVPARITLRRGADNVVVDVSYDGEIKVAA